MLTLLRIENIAVIEQASILFDRGFNVLTGETGAGKSIVIDAISAILGERAYRDVIRTGTQKAYVSACFEEIPQLPWFEENHVPYEQELQITREIFLDGRNVCKVNGETVTVSMLKRLGGHLIQIHGQHDSQQLFDEETHLSILDRFARNAALRETYAADFSEVLRLRQEIERLSMDEGEKLRRMETLHYQIDELERADLHIGEDETLETRRKTLQNAEKLVLGLQEAVADLSGDEERDGAVSLSGEAARALQRLTRYDDTLDTRLEALNDLYYRLQDVAEELRDYADSFAYSGEELEQIESRLDQIHKLKRKYGASCEEMLHYLEAARKELDEIAFVDDRLEALKKEQLTAETRAEATAAALHETRKTAAALLEARISDELSQLDMPKVRFVCEFSEIPLCTAGTDRVRFLMSANVGEALKPMSKVASGGELARIMLAMKNVLAELDAVPTLIFDEVDAGVSGRAAQKVAEKLRAVAQHKQVLCVTHLPQIAAMADTHMRIAKAEKNGRTYTSVTPLDFVGRKAELARIIGGAVITDTTLKSAEEMLRAQ